MASTELSSLTGERLFVMHVATDFRTAIASRIDAADRALASRWFEGLEQLAPVAPDDIFPGEQLLGHAPSLIRELAAFLRAPAQDAILPGPIPTALIEEVICVTISPRT